MKSDRFLSSAIAISGVLTYTYLMFLLPAGDTSEQFGTFIYNYYFLALIEGKLDIPLQIISVEGHYNSSGQAFVYHGIGPLITRAFAYPFVDLTKTSLAPFTVWVFAVAGSAAYHLLFLRVISRYGPRSEQLRVKFVTLIGLMVWFTSPGIYLVANDSVFHEPITMSYFVVSGFILLFSGPALLNKPWTPILVPLAIFAGLAVFTRPHIAIGLYSAVVLLSLLVLRKNGRKSLSHVITAMITLLIFGVSQIILNELRFGNIFQMHGSLHRDLLEYGYVYFGLEGTNSPRNLAFINHGTFNLLRIIPNGIIYLFDTRDIIIAPFFDKYNFWIQSIFFELTTNLGFIRQEPPHIGIILLWLPWFILIAAAIRLKPVVFQRWWIVVFAALVGALFVLSYGTITLRYITDIWPLIVTIAVYCLASLCSMSEEHFTRIKRTLAAILLGFTFSASLTFVWVSAYANYFASNEIQGQWSQKTCAKMIAQKETLGVDAVENLCVINMD